LIRRLISLYQLIEKKLEHYLDIHASGQVEPPQ
jgi:hypothetical protein